MPKALSKWWPLFGLLLVSILLAFLNYQPNTWLTGWDNLHPEFNFALNLSRSLNTTWQEYQGLGLLGGMAHAADLPRQLLLYSVSSIFQIPDSLFRYLWTFLMLIIGPLGVYFLSTSTLLKKFSPFTRRLAGFFAGLFYLLNLSTIQTFYTPFEAFVTFYGFLPWILYVTIRYLEKPTRLRFLSLASCLLLSAPAFYVQTLFLVLAICLSPILLGFLTSKKLSPHSLATCTLYLVTLLATQAYWLLPVGYFSATASSTTVNAPQNLVATPEIIARNTEFGTLPNIALLKGFWFKYADLNANNQFQPMMGPWVDHLNNPAISAIGYIFFALILIGVLFAIRHHLPHSVAFALIFGISIFFLSRFQILDSLFPVLAQAFRSVFTKWSIPASLAYSLFFAVAVVFLLQLFSSLHDRLTVVLTTFTIVFSLLAISGPAFSGNLIYPRMRVAVPNAYFQLFDYMRTQDPSTRIANFPQNTFWGWQFYSWPGSSNGGVYRGSGFIWYGLRQPVLDRAFDVWSPASAEYYTEVKTALYGQNKRQFDDVINKYSINWILIDNSVISPGATDRTSLYIPQLKDLITSDSRIKFVQSFDFLDLYQVSPDTKPSSFLSTVSVSSPQIPDSGYSLPVITDTPSDNHAVDLSKDKNCDPLNTGSLHKNISDTEVVYTSQGADSCDHFLYPELPLNKQYQIKIEHQNTSGLPFLYCVEPYPTKTCLLYGYLPKSSQFTTTTLTLPALKDGEFGFTLHLFNNSLGNIKTVNSWRKISISSQSSTEPSTELTNQRLTISHVSHPTYSLYALTARVDQQEADLTLSQSFDPLWRAFLVDRAVLDRPVWIQYLHSLFLVPLPESRHHLQSGWANSWTIPEGTHHLLIVYLPQHVQYFGFSLLLLPPFLFFLHHKKHK